MRRGTEALLLIQNTDALERWTWHAHKPFRGRQIMGGSHGAHQEQDSVSPFAHLIAIATSRSLHPLGLRTILDSKPCRPFGSA